jgi:ribosomal protein S14
MALKDTGLIRAKSQKGLSNFTTSKFHLTNRENAAKKFVLCRLKIRELEKVGNLEVFGLFLRIPKRD